MKQVWRASTNGPDWTDVRLYMVLLGQHHKCTVWLTLQPDGADVSTVLRVMMSASWEDLSASSATRSVTAAVTWPNVNNKTLEGCAYALAMMLDNVLMKERWTQLNLPAV